jgi:superfamily I DNA/RNA helicase
LTPHSAKGCEYDVVIMVGMDMGAMPDGARPKPSFVSAIVWFMSG